MATKFFEFWINNPTKNATIGKDHKYPPVNPNNIGNPPEKLAKTGIPNAPINKYVNCASPPLIGPKNAPDNKTSKVCKVNGTGCVGIEICAEIAVSTEKEITRTKSEFLTKE